MFGIFKKKLPHCDELFLKYLSPWYNEVDRPTMTRPDMYEISAFKSQELDINAIQYLTTQHLDKTKTLINVTMTEAMLKDFSVISNSKEIDFVLLDEVDKYFDRAKIAELINESDPKDFANSYLVAVCEFGILLGQLFRKMEGYDWLFSDPYYHSIIVHKYSGYGITVFDWAVKKFSEYGVDDGYVKKIHAAVKVIDDYCTKNQNIRNE